MTLIENILKKVQSKDSLRRYASPPPELDEEIIEKRVRKRTRKPLNRYPHVGARVDSAPPGLLPSRMCRYLDQFSRRTTILTTENVALLKRIKKQYYARGKVECRWDPPEQLMRYYENRRVWLKQVETGNKTVYERIRDAKARVETTAALAQRWEQDRRVIMSRATRPFVLFPRERVEELDPLFLPPGGVRRPRVVLSLRVAGGACLGRLTVELFSDVCPHTCRLFAELLRTDGPYTYIGTRFFTKVPQLYWRGGDVVLDNGFGCYMQRDRRVPIGAENFHFPHSMPGLLSMCVTRDDEMCGIFNITFKPLPQFDLKNVVFGRVVRPCSTYDVMTSFGCALSTQPVVRVEWARFVRARATPDHPLATTRPQVTSLDGPFATEPVIDT